MTTTYTVKPGDNMWDIAHAHRVSLSSLEHANPQETNPDLIHPGDRLTIPGSGGNHATRSPARASTTSYVIEPGDTLSGIADRFHTTARALASSNHIANPNLIYAGSTLQITGASRRAASGSGTAPPPPAGTPAANARIVARIAREEGVSPTLAVQMMLTESSGNALAVGDGGTSFGLFQLHEGGMLTAAGLSANQAFDPTTNARVALRALAATAAAEPGRDPGWIAADSQRPADEAGYAARVDSEYGAAQALLGN